MKKKSNGQKPKSQSQSKKTPRKQQSQPNYAPQAPKRNPTISSVLSDVGYVAGGALSKIFGLGAYHIKENSLMKSVGNAQVPVMHSASETVVFRHREFIGDITSSTAFSSQEFSVNPGLSNTFPFLSNIAANFQEYEFRGLIFEYKSTSADSLNSTNTALGTVILAAQYKADDPSFTSKAQMLNQMWSIDSRPSDSFILPIECDPSENPFKVQYVRTGALTSSQDRKMYDLCEITVATVGSQASSVVGELWASYEVAFRKPVAGGLTGTDISTAHFINSTNVVNASPLGTTGSGTLLYDNIGLTVTSTTITIPARSTFVGQRFQLYYYWAGGASAVLVNPAISLTASAGAGFNTWNNASASSVGSPVGASLNTLVNIQSFIISDNSIPLVITLGTAGTLPTSLTRVEFLLVEIPSSYV